MKRLISSFMFLLSISTLLFSQKEKIKWYTIEEAEKLIKENPRPIFIDTYTDWCSWCKKLDEDTFSNPVVAEILTSKYYPVKLDAEGKRPIIFQGRTFVNDGRNGKTHQLAVALLLGRGQSQIGYPTVVFLNEKGQLLAPVPGYKEPKEMEELLSYFAAKAYEKENLAEFHKSFKGKVK